MSAGLFLVAALVGQLPISTEAELPGGQKVQLVADQLVYEPGEDRYTAKGHTVLKSERLTLRADEISYEQKTQRAEAKGRVMLVSGQFAAIADAISVDLKTLEAQVEGGLFMQKRNVTAEQLLQAKTPQALREAGETVITLTGNSIRQVSPGRFEVDGLSFTPCDCNPTEPSWRVEASRADVMLNERAILHWPVVWVKSVPIFALPWLYLPLSERRTGLLFPKIDQNQNGISIQAPVFVTLGRSHDLTLTPAFFGGASSVPGVNAPKSGVGVKGPKLSVEYRYAPSHATSGRVSLGVLYDLWQQRNPLNEKEVVPDQIRGFRLDGTIQHSQDMGRGFRNRVDASFMSDGYYWRDLTVDVLAREQQYLRSTATLHRRTEDTYLGLDAVIRQDIRWGYSFLGQDSDAAGNPVNGPPPFQQLPRLWFAMPDKPLGPIWAGFRAELTRIGPLNALTGDEGTDGIFAPKNPDPDGTQGDRNPDPNEREPRSRIDFNPRLSAPMALGNAARVVPYVAYRHDVYLGETTGRTADRGYVLFGTEVSTELSRTFGRTVRHAITPAAEVRYVPTVFGGGWPQAYDEIDAAIHQAFFQGVVELRQRLWWNDNGTVKELLSLDVGQGLDLGESRLAETYVRLASRLGFARVVGTGRYDPLLGLVSHVSVGFGLDSGRGDAFWGHYDYVLGGGSDRMRRGIDTLFGPRSAGSSTELQPFQQLSLGASTQFKFGLGLRYGILLQEGVGKRVRSQEVAVSYSPACNNCWSVQVRAAFLADREDPILGFTLSIQNFGTFGS